MEQPVDHPVILFDGVCNLCNGFVQFVIARDAEKQFRFAPLQSAAGNRLREQYGVPDAVDSIVLLTGEEYFLKSAAAIRIVKRLGGLWPLLTVFLFVPRVLRDWVYDMVAAHRYQWFGKRDVCMTPTGDIKDRFLDTDT